MDNEKQNLIKGDYSDWIVQGFIRNEIDLELFLIPSDRSQLNSVCLGSSIRLVDVQEMEIWDFGMMQYDYLSYLISVPFHDKTLFMFSSSGGCHSHIFCSKIEENMFENRGYFVPEYFYENVNNNLREEEHNGIKENWHDYIVAGFLRYADKVEMLLSYPQQEICKEGIFPLAGKITFEGLKKQDISNFQVHNILSYVNAKEKEKKSYVDFDCSIGCNGYITCEKIKENKYEVKGKWEIKFK